MQELKQVERILSFEEICPEFSNILAENGGYMACRDHTFVAQDGSTRSIMDGMTCLVGEAHSNIVDEAHGH